MEVSFNPTWLGLIMKKVIRTQFPSETFLRTPVQLGEAIRASRTKAKMTIVEAAMTIGVAKQTLSDLEHGKPTVSLGITLKIAHELGVSLLMLPAELRSETKFTLLKAGII